MSKRKLVCLNDETFPTAEDKIVLSSYLDTDKSDEEIVDNRQNVPQSDDDVQKTDDDNVPNSDEEFVPKSDEEIVLQSDEEIVLQSDFSSIEEDQSIHDTNEEGPSDFQTRIQTMRMTMTIKPMYVAFRFPCGDDGNEHCHGCTVCACYWEADHDEGIGDWDEEADFYVIQTDPSPSAFNDYPNIK